MHVGLGGNHSVIRMSLRPNAPYRERVEDGGSTLLRSVGRLIAAQLQRRANCRFAIGPRRTAFAFVFAVFALCAFQTQSDAASLRVGFLSPGTPESAAPVLAGLRQGLRENGFVEGDVVIDSRARRRRFARSFSSAGQRGARPQSAQRRCHAQAGRVVSCCSSCGVAYV